MSQKLLLELENELSEVKKLLRRIERELKKLPKGTLEVSRARQKYVQYHAVREEDGKRVRVFIPKKDIKYACQLAQRSYETKLRKIAERRCRILEKTLETLRDHNLEEVYEKETEERKQLITPLIPTDEQIISQWYADHPADQNDYPKSMTYTTLHGEEVRSKSEKMIADTYYAANIPYVYEPSLTLEGGKKCYPDFAVLNLHERKTMYHEHFGMMDEDGYRRNAIDKMREYNANGYRPGEEMIYTFEGELIPFDQEELSRIVCGLLP